MSIDRLSTVRTLPLNQGNARLLLILGSLLLLHGFTASAFSAEPLKGGVQEKGYVDNPMQGSAIYGYPSPQMIRQTPQQGVQTTPPLHHQPAQREPLKAAIQQKVVLPPQFMGVWHVQGQRSKVEAMPDFQAGAERAFNISTTNTWQISGNESSGYSMSSNDGVQTPLYVQSVQGNTAFIRYQHPINNTMAQEAFVMSLVAGGAQFNGLTRISIVKQGEPGPRAKVTYQLVGHRQR
jgi:hypothetical protein